MKKKLNQLAFRFILVGLYCFSFLPLVFAGDAVVLDGFKSFHPLGEQAEILSDPSGELTFDQVQNQTSFMPSPGAAPNMGITQDVHWIKFKIKNSSLRQDWLFVVHSAAIDQVQVWWRQGSGEFNHANLDENSILERKNPLRLPVVLLKLPLQSETEFWVRLWDEGTFPTP